MEVKPPLEQSYVNDPEKNPFRRIWDSDRFCNASKYPLADFPAIVDIEPTNHCNLECAFCGREIMKREKGFMDFVLYRRIVDEVAQNNRAIKFSMWGEPFLHPKIYEMFTYAKEKGLLVHVTTNGILFDPYRLNNIDSINFSFQGTTREEYTLIRNNGFYDLIVDKIETLLSLDNRPAVGITTTVLDETEEQIADFINKWIDEVEQVNWGYTYYTHLDGEHVKELKKRQNSKIRTRPCNNLMVNLGVYWDGYVSGCCGDWDRQMLIGYLGKSTIRELWTCQKMQDYRELNLAGKLYKIRRCRICNNRW